VLNTILAGIWLSVAYVKTRSLWLPTGLHFAWNFSLAFIYGFPVSGLRVSQPIFHVEQGGPEWMTGGSYGPEGGALGLIVIVAGAVWVWTSRHVRASDQARALWEEAAAVPEEQ
jgi:hypothetical protein